MPAATRRAASPPAVSLRAWSRGSGSRSAGYGKSAFPRRWRASGTSSAQVLRDDRLERVDVGQGGDVGLPGDRDVIRAFARRRHGVDHDADVRALEPAAPGAAVSDLDPLG